MKLSSLLALPAGLIAAVYANDYSENLHLKPLPGGSLYAGFDFTASTPLEAYERQNFRFFPRSLGQILQFTHTKELHLRFALGRWDETSWGSRPRNGRREGGTGVELWAWLEGDTRAEAEERWSGLVNSLSGLFCASLNFIDQTKTIQPILSFDPEGTLKSNASGLHLMHGVLPHEVVCTENLTPFLKLLPCKGKAGVSSLLDGHKVFDANWQTMAIDVKSDCGADGRCGLQIQQTVDLVLDIERSMRPQDNPIPRPLPMDKILCDQSKEYNSHDSCYPIKPAGETEWSISRIFGRAIKGSCSPSGDHDVSEDFLDIPTSRLVIATSAQTTDGSSDEASRHYKLQADGELDLALPQQVLEDAEPSQVVALHASRQITGYGQERGGMHTVITNPYPHSQRIVYLESLPWFLRPYMHTLDIKGASIEKMYYSPAVDRKRGTQLELVLNIPAMSTIDLTYDFEKAILRYTEYPPDANRGFDIAPAIIRVLSEDGGQDSYLRTTSLLLPLPTPDFSMPYNVIILTSTVIALGFGSIFNLLIRRFVLAEEVPKSPLVAAIANFVAKVKGAIGRTKKSRPAVNARQEGGGRTDGVSTSADLNGHGGTLERKTRASLR
jgi:phosphatidylinositol glycan class T